MAVCHNGNLVNAPKLRRKLEMSGSIFHGTSDTEVIAYLLTQNRLLTPNIEMAVSRTMDDIDGAYSLVIMTHTKLIAARDPNGFRPLCIGELPTATAGPLPARAAHWTLWARSSSAMFSPARSSLPTTTACAWRITAARAAHDVRLEYIYLPARIPSSRAPVHEARLQAGRFLAQEHPVEADVVIGAPDLVWMQRSAMRRRAASPRRWLHQKQIRRPYLHSGQPSPAREQRAHQAECHFVHGQGKRVVLVDDSIVRGTTSARTIRLREAGAAEVHYRISARRLSTPATSAPTFPTKDLIATGHTVEINELVGSDTLGYLSIVQQLAIHSKCGFCTAALPANIPSPRPPRRWTLSTTSR